MVNFTIVVMLLAVLLSLSAQIGIGSAIITSSEEKVITQGQIYLGWLDPTRDPISKKKPKRSITRYLTLNSFLSPALCYLKMPRVKSYLLTPILVE
jgi:hypothetical protein